MKTEKLTCDIVGCGGYWESTDGVFDGWSFLPNVVDMCEIIPSNPPTGIAEPRRAKHVCPGCTRKLFDLDFISIDKPYHVIYPPRAAGGDK